MGDWWNHNEYADRLGADRRNRLGMFKAVSRNNKTPVTIATGVFLCPEMSIFQIKITNTLESARVSEIARIRVQVIQRRDHANVRR